MVGVTPKPAVLAPPVKTSTSSSAEIFAIDWEKFVAMPAVRIGATVRVFR